MIQVEGCIVVVVNPLNQWSTSGSGLAPMERRLSQGKVPYRRAVRIRRPANNDHHVTFAIFDPLMPKLSGFTMSAFGYGRGKHSSTGVGRRYRREGFARGGITGGE